MLAKANLNANSASALGSVGNASVNLAAMANQSAQNLIIAQMGTSSNNMPSRPQYQLAGLESLGITMPT